VPPAGLEPATTSLKRRVRYQLRHGGNTSLRSLHPGLPILEGATPVAVGAADLALRDLSLEPIQAAAAPGKLDHVRTLICNVIELEHDEIGKSAVDAKGLQQRVAHEHEVSRLAG
jgi:hypothetical protein